MKIIRNFLCALLLCGAAQAGPDSREPIYHVCAGPQFDSIQVRRSDDRGETWSEPVRPDRPGHVTLLRPISV